MRVLCKPRDRRGPGSRIVWRNKKSVDSASHQFRNPTKVGAEHRNAGSKGFERNQWSGLQPSRRDGDQIIFGHDANHLIRRDGRAQGQSWILLACAASQS